MVVKLLSVSEKPKRKAGVYNLALTLSFFLAYWIMSLNRCLCWSQKDSRRNLHWDIFRRTVDGCGGSRTWDVSAIHMLTPNISKTHSSKYNKFGRTYLFDIDFHHLKEGNRRWENSFTVDAYHAGNVSFQGSFILLITNFFFFLNLFHYIVHSFLGMYPFSLDSVPPLTNESSG